MNSYFFDVVSSVKHEIRNYKDAESGICHVFQHDKQKDLQSL